MKRTNGITKQFWDPLYQSTCTLVARACATQKWFSARLHYKHPIDTYSLLAVITLLYFLQRSKQ